MSDTRIEFYNEGSPELRWEMRAQTVPRVGDTVVFPNGREVTVVKVVWTLWNLGEQVAKLIVREAADG